MKMELYDKDFVKFEWEEDLTGKKVFVAPDIETLKYAVNGGDISSVDASFGKVTFNTPQKPFHCEKGEDNYMFAYYDPYYDVKKAFSEGRPIEGRMEKWYEIHTWKTLKFAISQGMEIRIKRIRK